MSIFVIVENVKSLKKEWQKHVKIKILTHFL